MATPSYQDYLALESRAVPDVLRPAPPPTPPLGHEPLAASRYTSREFFDRECERLWPKVWQMACREEEIPAAGDYVVYEIVDYSFVVMRGSDGAIRAFINVCPHRGRQLLSGDGNREHIRCAFHGITWNIDGALQSLPCRWDFEHVPANKWALTEVRVDTWGGFVFLNMDRNARPLAEFLDVLPAHFARWPLERCWKAAHVGKVIACNWKVAQEAFMESYHVIATHPQILPIIADANSQYDLYGDHVNRNIAAFGAPSPHLGDQVAAEQIVEQMLSLWHKAATPRSGSGPVQNARAVLGELNRRAFQRAYEGDYSQATDAELLDAIVYNVFPNFAPWGGFAPNIVYRWRPNGRDVDSCIMEVMLLKRLPKNGSRPAPVKLHWLGANERWADAEELPILGAVIDQDMNNMPLVQRGLKAAPTGEVQLGQYQESRIRHFHRTLDRYLERD
jgi:nitrite reductase/ring-hydroxylating ferredoxin subunit